MCGIFGVLTSERSSVSPRELRAIVDTLFRLSESRGREAAGLAAMAGDELFVFKEPHSASEVLGSDAYSAAFKAVIGAASQGNDPQDGSSFRATAIIGHSRLVTNGLEIVHENNQPVVSGGLVGVHNGIVVNERELWAKHAGLTRTCEVDTEVVLQLLDKRIAEGHDAAAALGLTYEDIFGETTVAVLAPELDAVLFGTNTGSLYYIHSSSHDVLVFASERYIIEQLIAHRRIGKLVADGRIEQLSSQMGLVVNAQSLDRERVDLRAIRGVPRLAAGAGRVRRRPVRDLSSRRAVTTEVFPSIGTPAVVPPAMRDEQRCRAEVVDSLRRCSRCVLPETMPFITFDDTGICNYCRHHEPIHLLGRDALEQRLASLRKESGQPDLLMTFSGGRDSSYGLHYLVKEMGMRPIAYTYDWGMVTDLARRNQARLCGKLGIEHIWVSADIKAKRANIRKNVTAWLDKPDLGMIPLFMAGDKQFFYYANKVKEQTKLDTVVLCENLLEKTAFKSGFCGIPPSHETKSVYALSLGNKAKMLTYYGSRYLGNPGYLNSSILDTLSAYASYYVIDHNFLSLFQYIDWNESEIESILIGEYDWETAPDTRSTWRIGDGTAPFYNYIYYMVAGFTENDTFRSNQIREGKIDRAEALERVREDNRPRYDSLKWYCDTIGIDFLGALRRIHAIPALYATRR